MKYKLLAVAVLLLAQATMPAAAQTRSFYDRNGSFAGSSSTPGNSTSFSDTRDRFSGSAIRNSNGTTSFYDRSGRFSGFVSRR